MTRQQPGDGAICVPIIFPDSPDSSAVCSTSTRTGGDRMLVGLLIGVIGMAIGIVAGIALHSVLAGVLAGVCVATGVAYVVLP
jgi:hypothetical protein